MKPSINAYMSVHDQPDRPMWAATAPKGRSVIAVGVLASQAAVSLKDTAALDSRKRFRDFVYCSGDCINDRR
jgi:hypothetical protein